MRKAILLPIAILLVAPAAHGQSGESKKKKSESAEAREKRLEENRKRRARERERRIRERILGARDLETTIAPWAPDITECYRKFGVIHRKATGVLNLEIVVRPAGKIRNVYVTAPGVRGTKLKRCIEKIAAKMQFPTRKGFTKATVPFRFLASARKAGPLRSCWSKTGCSSKRKAKRRASASKTKQKKAGK